MSLLSEWREFAYSHDDRTQEGQRFWIDYFQQEKAVYEQILARWQSWRRSIIWN